MEKWFANRGQAVQVICAVVSCVVIIVNVIVVREKVVSTLVLLLALAWLAFSVIIYFRNQTKGTQQQVPLDARPSHPIQIGEISFNYLPTCPLSRDWKIAYEDPGNPPRFTVPPRAPGGISILVDRKYAIDCSVPAKLRTANRLRLSINYTDSAMFFTELAVSSRDGTQSDLRWIKYYVGTKSPEQTQGYPKESTVWVQPQFLEGGWVSFDLDLPGVVREAIGGEGWVYRCINTIRLRGSISVSPILFLGEQA